MTMRPDTIDDEEGCPSVAFLERELDALIHVIEHLQGVLRERWGVVTAVDLSVEGAVGEASRLRPLPH